MSDSTVFLNSNMKGFGLMALRVFGLFTGLLEPVGARKIPAVFGFRV